MLTRLRSWLATTLLALFLSAVVAQAQGLQDPLRPTDTASPRATLFSFIEKVNAAYAHALAGEKAESQADLDAATRYVDLSAYPRRVQEYQKEELVLLLKEILDRIELPAPEDVPGAAEATGQRRDTGILIGGPDAAGVQPIELWQIPATNVRIYRVKDGPRAGEYIFSPDTMARVGRWYARISKQPYVSTETPDLYFAFALTPGRGINPARAEGLPQWMLIQLGGQTLWQVLATTAVLLLLALFIRLALSAGRAVDNRLTVTSAGQDWKVWRPGRLIATFLCAVGAFYAQDVIDDAINLTGYSIVAVGSLLVILGYAFLAAFLFTLVSQLTEVIISVRGINRASSPAQLFRLIGYAVGTLAVVAVFIAAAEEFGIPAAGMIAGLGVGGIAISLAARESLMDLFSSVVVMLERPYRIGDYITFGAHSGKVLEIGLRSTKLLTSDNLVISIPHSKLSSSAIENYGFRHARLINTVVWINDGTPTERITDFMDRVRESLAENPLVDPTDCLVHLQAFGQGKLEVLLYFYLRITDWSGFVREREKVLLRIVDCAVEAGVELAPTQTIETTAQPDQTARL